MPIKRPHKKSRYGCDTCRKRRVKCDEKRPRCANCTTRDEACHFSRQASAQPHGDMHYSESPSGTASSHETPPGLISSNGTDLDHSLNERHPYQDRFRSDSVRLRELKLMHHWCTRTCHGFPPQSQERLRDHITKEAFRHDYLMAALLSITSMHIACEKSANDELVTREYASAGLQYQNEALSGLREVLGTITSDNCDAVFMAAASLMICTIVSPFLPVGSHHEKQSARDAMLPIVDLLKGIISIIDITRHWLDDGLSHAMLVQEKNTNTMLHQSWPVEDLRRLNKTFASTKNHRTFDYAIEKLVEVASNGKSVLPFLLRAGPEYMEELRQGNPVALAIFMHWGTLLDGLEDMWWSDYCGKRLVKEMAETLHRKGPEWEQVTRWCRVQVGLLNERGKTGNENDL